MRTAAEGEGLDALAKRLNQGSLGTPRFTLTLQDPNEHRPAAVLATRRHFPRMNAIRALAQAIRTSGLSPVQMLDDRGEPLVPGRCAAH